jgi:uracil-DNA glycosylase
MNNAILPANALTLGMRPLLTDLHPEWQTALKPARDTLVTLATMLSQRRVQGAVIFPADPFRALRSIAPQDVRVVILGQDPYHGPGQAQGLAFSVPDDCASPPSLRNIFKELALEFPDRPKRTHNDLSDWADQGVLLLNTSLTVEAHKAGSHAKQGWEAVTDALILHVARQAQPKVFLLWGAHAQAKRALLNQPDHGPHAIFMSNHPSPLSAQRPPVPFIGCGHFAKANAWLHEQGQAEIDWIG